MESNREKSNIAIANCNIRKNHNLNFKLYYPISNLLKVVRPTNLVPADALLDAIQSRTDTKDSELKYRGHKMIGSLVISS